MYVLVNLNLASEAELAKKRFHLNFLHLRVCVGRGGGGGGAGIRMCVINDNLENMNKQIRKKMF